MNSATDIAARRARRQKRTKKQAEPWHGSVNGYTNHTCRCALCRAAFAKYQRDYRASRFLKKDGTPKSCIIRGCKRVQSKAKGNGMCARHSEEYAGA